MSNAHYSNAPRRIPLNLNLHMPPRSLYNPCLIAATDRQIDQLVYALYGLSEE